MQGIVFEKKGHVVRLILKRPEGGNPLDATLARELCETCEQIADDDEVYAVVLGNRGDVFCIGSGEAPDQEMMAGAAAAVEAVAALEVPVIGSLDGSALSEGLELALACDIRIGSQGELGLSQIVHGRIPSCGGTQRLPRVINKGKATEMILTGEAISAEKAYRIGLLNRLAPKGKALAAAEALAEKIAANGPIAARYAKEAILKGLDRPLDQAIHLEIDLSLILQTTADRAEGLKSFLERRPPHYKGK